MKFTLVCLLALVSVALAATPAQLFTQNGVTILQPQAPQAGDSNKGETILVAAPAAQQPQTQTTAAPAPAQVNNSAPIATSASGAPLYQVKVELPNACACTAQPCSCNQQTSQPKLVVTFIEEHTAAEDPSTGTVVMAPTNLGDPNKGETVLKPATAEQAAASPCNCIASDRACLSACSAAVVAAPAATAAPSVLAGPTNQSVATSADGKPLFPVLVAQPSPCACMMNDNPCRARCASLMETKSTARRLRTKLARRADPAPQANALNPQQPFNFQPINGGQPTLPLPATPATPATPPTPTPTAPQCADTMVFIHNTNSVQTINSCKSKDAKPATDKAGDLAAAPANNAQPAAPAAAAATQPIQAAAAQANQAQPAAPQQQQPAVPAAPQK